MVSLTIRLTLSASENFQVLDPLYFREAGLLWTETRFDDDNEASHVECEKREKNSAHEAFEFCPFEMNPRSDCTNGALAPTCQDAQDLRARRRRPDLLNAGFLGVVLSNLSGLHVPDLKNSEVCHLSVRLKFNQE